MDANDGVTAAEQALVRLLERLADETPEESFDRLGEALSGLPTEAGRKSAALVLARAGRVRDMLAQRQRREREMQALLDTARDLASVRQVDTALEAIVARARQLLGTDTAYLALVDTPTGDVYMSVTFGTITRAIELVRQPQGCGVGGRVVLTGRPFATANYQRDARIQRDQSVASAVEKEGLVSILGVPLRVGDAVIGALFSASRDERAFERSDIDLLSALADHAAVVLENARLFTEAEATASALGRANDQLARHNQSLERAASAHEQLMAMVLRRADLTELVEAVATMLDAAIVAVRPDGIPLARGAAEAARGLIDQRPATFLAGRTSGGPGRPGSARLVGRLDDAQPVLAVPVQAGSESVGHLLAAFLEDPPDTEVRILELAAQTAALLLLVERQMTAAEQQVRGKIVDELLADREPDWAALERRAKLSGALDLDVAHTVIVLSGSGVPSAKLLRAAADFAAARDGVATEHGATTVVLLPTEDTKAAGHGTRIHLQRTTGSTITAGVAGPATSGPALRKLHREAERCHQLLMSLRRTGTSACLADLGVLGLVLDGTPPEQLHRLVGETLGPVLDYDAEHGSTLASTLDSYFAAAKNPRAAARLLQVHPNTVYQRLERVDRVLGHRRWREPSGSLAMQLALQLRRILVAS